MSGRIEQHPSFRSKLVADRRVDVWVPASYDAALERRYPVLYMHDGQNLFEPEHSFAGVDWAVHRALAKLALQDGLSEAIIVGIWNTNERIPEYMPERPMRDLASDRTLERFAETYGGEPKSDAYLGFITSELKPFIDDRYRTRPDRKDTFMMGSSMGGLISLYGLCEHPDVFGGAACLSTSWTIVRRVMLVYLQRYLPPAGAHHLYFDYGVEAQIAQYESLQKNVNRVVARAGYRLGEDWMTERFPGDPHSESAWRDRVDVPLRFLLGPLGT